MILATQEAEIGRTLVQGQLKQKVPKTLSQPTARYGGMFL
jgi:hypothetical protein